ncbi:MAG: trehalose-6-phosphate synthase, partial [Alphaproteobacteria bacterium]|nr:trehalose-6-phosphate synthase [Alphaproteobacteria bacterium]
MTPAGSRLVVVSNRVAASKRTAAGGLAVALREALADSGGLWFGWSGRTIEGIAAEPTITQSDGITFATVDLTTTDYNDYYKGFSNRTLWPLFHYRVDLTTFDRGFHAGYIRVNAQFARALSALLQPTDLVWVHDYHMIAVGQELRRLGAKNRLGFFLHIPFPATEVLLTLPTHRELVQALFAYDLVGFQAPSDLRAFRDYVMVEAGGRVFEDGRVSAFGRTIRADVFPIGIDADEFAALAQTPEADRTAARLLDSAGGDVIIGVDRLDYSKGLIERFDALEALLTAYPDNRGRVSMLQIAPPSRSDVPEYIRLRRELEAAAGRINGRFAEFDWVPLRYLNRPFNRRVLAALYRASKIGLVTPFRDGMNLVAKEYV